jgi:hypothetical protein
MFNHKLPMLCLPHGPKFVKRAPLTRGDNPPEPPAGGEA